MAALWSQRLMELCRPQQHRLWRPGWLAGQACQGTAASVCVTLRSTPWILHPGCTGAAWGWGACTLGPCAWVSHAAECSGMLAAEYHAQVRSRLCPARLGCARASAHLRQGAGELGRPPGAGRATACLARCPGLPTPCAWPQIQDQARLRLPWRGHACVSGAHSASFRRTPALPAQLGGQITPGYTREVPLSIQWSALHCSRHLAGQQCCRRHAIQRHLHPCGACSQGCACGGPCSLAGQGSVASGAPTPGNRTPDSQAAQRTPQRDSGHCRRGRSRSAGAHDHISWLAAVEGSAQTPDSQAAAQRTPPCGCCC